MNEPSCNCPDTKVNGRRLVGIAHDCIYTRRRGALVPQAEALALCEIGPGDGPSFGNRFTRSFAKHMETLVKQADL